MDNETKAGDCVRIYEKWHELAKAREVDGLLALYAEDAIFESPLVPAILETLQSAC